MIFVSQKRTGEIDRARTDGLLRGERLRAHKARARLPALHCKSPKGNVCRVVDSAPPIFMKNSTHWHHAMRRAWSDCFRLRRARNRPSVARAGIGVVPIVAAATRHAPIPASTTIEGVAVVAPSRAVPSPRARSVPTATPTVPGCAPTPASAPITAAKSRSAPTPSSAPVAATKSRCAPTPAATPAAAPVSAAPAPIVLCRCRARGERQCT